MCCCRITQAGKGGVKHKPAIADADLDLLSMVLRETPPDAKQAARNKFLITGEISAVHINTIGLHCVQDLLNLFGIMQAWQLVLEVMKNMLT